MLQHFSLEDKFLVIGAGASGIAAARMLTLYGYRVTLLEKDPVKLTLSIQEQLDKDGIELTFGEIAPYYFEDVQYVVPSPGISLHLLYKHMPKSKKIHILGELELGFLFLENEHCIAITGTAGKTTVTHLITALLERNGLTVFMGGNVGTPLCDYIYRKTLALGDARYGIPAQKKSFQKADVVVLEVSSFQLQTTHTFHPKVAVFTNISANHLDYHHNFEEYLQAKLRIFKNQNKNDFAILHASMKTILQQHPEKIHAVTRYYATNEDIFPAKYLLGLHNQENMLAALQAAHIFGVTEQTAKEVFSTYPALPYRLEPITTLHGVRYINDSKATTPESLKTALQALNAPIILLAGGKFKGGNLTALRQLIQEKVKAICLFGGSKEVFMTAWSGIVPITHYTTLQEAVLAAQHIAVEGDSVLLSPATASFDAFSSYQERGDLFKKTLLEHQP